MDNYWARVLKGRVIRRRAIAETGGAALAIAFLAACGGNKGQDAGKGAQGDQSGLLSKAVDTASRATAGGVWQTSAAADIVSLDPNTTSSSGQFDSIVPFYSQLLKYGKSTNGRQPSAEAITGDAAQSWEITPDGQQITLKLRDNHKFDPRPPTNGRAMTSEDVKSSWDRTVALSPLVAEVVQSKNPSGPIASLSTPDSRTIVIKLAFPYGSITSVLAHHLYLWLVPKEADGGFNPKAEGRGSGPFFLEKWTPSVGFEYKKNPDWYEKGRPFLDGISKPIIPDYAAGLAQFESKTLWDFAVRQEDILRVKKDHPELVMLNDVSGTGSGWYFPFSLREDSPMKDVRLRRAASMLLDREAIIETLYGLDKFRDVGLPVEGYWNSHLVALAPNWSDPKTKELGEGAKYFQHNDKDAKALMSAAGYNKSKQLSFFYDGTTSSSRLQMYTIMSNMLSDGGFNLDFKPLQYPNPWRDICQNSGSQDFSGLCLIRASGFNDEAYLTSKYTPDGTWSFSKQPFPGITDAVHKARTETDPKRQAELIKQIDKDLAMLMPDMMTPGYAQGFTLNWPWLKNYGVYTPGGSIATASSSRIFTEYWYDASART